MAEIYDAQVVNGVIVLEKGAPSLPDGTRLRVATIAATIQEDPDPMAATRVFLLAAARAAEADADECPLPADLAENHDHYAHGRPLE